MGFTRANLPVPFGGQLAPIPIPGLPGEGFSGTDPAGPVQRAEQILRGLDRGDQIDAGPEARDVTRHRHLHFDLDDCDDDALGDLRYELLELELEDAEFDLG